MAHCPKCGVYIKKRKGKGYCKRCGSLGKVTEEQRMTIKGMSKETIAVNALIAVSINERK